MKKILVILDGASGLPEDCFGEKTPLEAADTPNLDYFTQKGKMGYMHVINEKKIPESDNAIISILGNDSTLSRRGVFEAIAAGVRFTRGDLCLRTNFGTIDNLKNKKVIDRRAGRTLTTKEAKILADSLNKDIKLPCKFEFKPSVQHRGILVLRGGFSDNISNIDSEYSNFKRNRLTFQFSKPFDDEDEIAQYACNILNDFIVQAFDVLENHLINVERRKKGLLPANMVFVRGPGIEIPKLKRYSDWMSINSMPLELGISKASWMSCFSFPYPKLKKIDVYSNLYASLKKSIKFSIKMIKRRHKDYIGCYIQFKETDVPGHDNNLMKKRICWK